MIVTRDELVGMISEAVRARLRALNERGKKRDEEEIEDEPAAKAELAGAGAAGDDPVANPKNGRSPSSPPPPGQDVDAEDEQPPTDADQGSSEQQAADERDALDLDGDAGDDATGGLNDALSGKTVQSISMEPKSREQPGAKEIVMSFNETTDALKIFIHPSGKVLFKWRDRIHDVP